MTIISNHRVHSYKASTSLHRRDVSPKKVLSSSINKMSFDKKYQSKKSVDISNTEVKEEMDTEKFIPTLLTALSNYAGAFQYKLLMPFEHLYEDDIETLDALEAVEALEEKKALEEMKAFLATDDILIDMEEAWSHYDYLEYLCD